MTSMRLSLALALGFVLAQGTPALGVGFVEESGGSNEALIVGVGHGLQGLDIDVDNLEKLSEHAAYKYQVSILEEAQGTTKAIAENLTRLSERAGADGTFFFYFTGHGNVGLIWPQDKTMHIKDIRAAMEKGRDKVGPLKRLVLMFDTCHAGSLLDPVRHLFPIAYDARVQSALFADHVVSEMQVGRDEKPYWEKLLVFASSRADESSLASPDGSIYTLAMMKAFAETAQSNGTIGEFQKKSEDYTKGHHPVARFVPASLKAEKLVD